MTTDGKASTSGDSVYMTSPTYSPAVDMTNSEFVIALKVTDYSKLKASNWFAFYAGDTALTNYWLWQWNYVAETSTATYLTPDGSWVLLRLPWSMGAAHNTPTRSAITVLRIKIFDRYDNVTPTSPAHVRIGYIGAAQDVSHLYPNGMMSWTLDDGWLTQYTLAQSVFDSYDIRPTLHLIDDQVGAVNYMTLAQVRALIAKGWTVGTHASTLASHNLGYPALGASAAAADLATSIAQHKAWGIGWRNFAYPLGAFDGTTGPAIMALGIRSARLLYVPAAGNFSETWPPTAPERVFSYSMTSVTVANAKAYLDTCKANHAWCVFVAHQFSAHGTSSVTTTTSIDDLRAILQYAKAQGIAHVPEAELLP